MMTREDIEKRLGALKSDLQALDHRASAIQGAILDCEFWLGELEKAEKAKEEKPDDTQD